MKAYGDLRHPVDRRVMRRVARMLAPRAAQLLVPIVAPQLRTWVLGLDHPVELA